jgi:hypothetical protein
MRLAREHAAAVLASAAGLALMAWLGLADFAFNDYDSEASAAVRALTSGHIGDFLVLAPAYGGSIAVRSPFALAPSLWGGGELAVYRMLALPGLLAAGVLAVWLAARLRALGRPTLVRATAIVLLVANPAALYALQIGHAEEILAAATCVAAVLAARAGRPIWAGALLGVAIATKSWAILALAPVLVPLPRGRWRALLLAGTLAALVLAPFAIAHQVHSAGGAASAVAVGSGPIFEPAQAWWFVGHHAVVRGANGHVKPGYRAQPTWLSAIAHPLIVLLAVPISLLWIRRRRGRALDPLGLLALLLLLRCALDPWNNLYYTVPLIFALTVWETLTRRDAPVLALVTAVLGWVTFRELPGHVSPDAQSTVYLAWAVPVGMAIVARAFAAAPRVRGGKHAWPALSLRRSAPSETG